MKVKKCNELTGKVVGDPTDQPDFIKAFVLKRYRQHPRRDDILQEAYRANFENKDISINYRYRCIYSAINDFIKKEALVVSVPDKPVYKVKRADNRILDAIGTENHYDFIDEEYTLYLLSKLDTKSIYIIESLFGLNNKVIYTQEEIASNLKISLSTVKRMKASALSKLKQGAIEEGKLDMRFKNERVHNEDGTISNIWYDSDINDYSSEVEDAEEEEKAEMVELAIKKVEREDKLKKEVA